MNNEVLFLALVLLDLLFVLFAWRLGKDWLVIAIVTNVILTTTFGAKLIPVFGLVSSVTNVFYAAIFIGTDILTEHHGKKEGYRSIWLGFLALFIFVAFGQFALLLSTVEDSAVVSGAMDTLFGAVPRIAAASFLAYLIAQHLDIWLFHRIGELTEGRKLWLRNCVSTLASQLLDSVIFFSLAFAGTVPNDVLINIMITGYLLKASIALLDTPFIYLSYIVKGKTLPGNDSGVRQGAREFKNC